MLLRYKLKKICLLSSVTVLGVAGSGSVVFASSCGGGNQSVNTSINFGCSNSGNPIADFTFSIIRFLSVGVGIVLVLSLIIAGIQYMTAGGEPQSMAKAKSRIMSTVIALLVYIFAYTILNFVVPGGLIK